jgi:alkylation response protein AidB-like acyl-CoA dehydrogenase
MTSRSDSAALESFRHEVALWLEANLPEASVAHNHVRPRLDVTLFHRLEPREELDLVRRQAAWQKTKYEAGYGALSWPVEFGGRGLDARYDAVLAAEEARTGAPVGHELLSVTLKLVAPVLREYGRGSPRIAELVRAFLSGGLLCCQLFSEPQAGSDLAALATRAREVGDGWILSGQKVWSSGAHLADWGLILARSDPDAAKHRGISAFLMPMDAPGVEIRPIRQMVGGTAFCEVFLDEVSISADLQVGNKGEGWQVALRTLSYEREVSDGSLGLGGGWTEVRQLAESTGSASDPRIRLRLADVFAQQRINELCVQADTALRASGHDLGVIGSLRKLQWVALLRDVSETVTRILGERLVVDTGAWGSYEWNDHVLGSLGYSLAGGTDEIQRNLVAERLLGLPPEPRTDNVRVPGELPR